jgi:hypothetical protein
MVLHSIRMLCSAATFALAAALSISVASAASPDGSGAAPQAQLAAPQTSVVSNCGAQIFSQVATQNAAAFTSSTSFVTIKTFSFAVPAGAARCIKVLFTAEAACAGSGITDFCYVRAVINGVEMFPQGQGFQTLQSEDGSAAGHAYEWFRRVGAGTYTVSVQGRVGNSASSFFIDDWTVDFQLTN